MGIIGTVFEAPADGIWAQRGRDGRIGDYHEGVRYWTVQVEGGWVGVADGVAVTEPMAVSGLAQRAVIQAIRAAKTEREQAAVAARKAAAQVARTAPSEAQIRYAMDLLARLTEDEVFDLDCVIGGSHRKPTAEQLRRYTKADLGRIIDCLVSRGRR